MAQDNLLVNPGFEPPFDPVTGVVPGQIAQGWTPWSITDNGALQPEYYPASDTVSGMGTPRIQEGEDAQQYFSFFASHVAGVYQRVSGLTAGDQVEFSIFAWLWSSSGDDTNVSAAEADMTIEVGIDPTGGEDATSESIVWSEAQSTTDQFIQLSVQATAEGDAVTVFVRSVVNQVLMNNVVYLDEASLTVVSAGAAETAEATEAVATDEVATEEVATEVVATEAVTEIVDLPTDAPTATEAVVEVTAEATEAPPTEEPTEEVPAATPEATVEATEEETEAPVLVATVLMTEAATEEVATEEATEEATPQATEEPTVEVIEVEPTATVTPLPTQPPPTAVPTATEIVPTALPPSATLIPPTVTPSPTLNLTVFPFLIAYTVQSGDFVAAIAERYNTTAEAIIIANGLGPEAFINAGQQLLIPVAALPTATQPVAPTAEVTIIIIEPTTEIAATAVPPTVEAPTAQVQVIEPTTAVPVVVASPTVPPSVDASAVVVEPIRYTVRYGDTLSSIAAAFRVPARDLARFNRIVNPNLVYVGQLLLIPVGGVPTATPTMFVPTLTRIPPTPVPPTATQPAVTAVYYVRPGDTLYVISIRFNVRISDLMRLNRIADANRIYVGQLLYIP
ncbi:MAG: LysM peptidoglycan-binding domain-containing protein [Chloroflexi bacterium]|nr:LysM peptidoglycan-binding domain-containing protein [Chloroflexota bacterium]